MTPAEFWNLLAAHDWFYSYSDDHRYWLAGSKEAKVIQDAVRADLSLSAAHERWLAWLNGAAERPTTLEAFLEETENVQPTV